VGFVVDKAALGQVFSEYLGFPCQAFYRLLYTHHHPGMVQEPSSGLNNSGLGSSPRQKEDKKFMAMND
jgi:hypothetical protein